MRFFMTGGSSVSGSKMPNCFCNMFVLLSFRHCFQQSRSLVFNRDMPFPSKMADWTCFKGYLPNKVKVHQFIGAASWTKKLAIEVIAWQHQHVALSLRCWRQNYLLGPVHLRSVGCSVTHMKWQFEAFLVPDAHRYFLFELQRPGIHHGCTQ